MSLNLRLLAITAGVLVGVSFIFFTVSNAVPIWSKVNIEDTESTIGLWKRCRSTDGHKECHDIECSSSNDMNNDCGKRLAARAFVTLACIFSGISTICLLVCAVTGDNTSKTMLLAAKGLVIVCLVMGVIGIGIGIDVHHRNLPIQNLKLGAAAIIGIVAIILNFFAAITAGFMK
ncbi:unnamed protein product [Rotaria socialis]|uniref:Uncharacterized protein n=1 Tax=Rotaria socialis TaxID=392032 RepID=A0A817ZM24_9BILA|nr:unnamed protein product [Rotaria socialis]CAF4521987.1 unnamed protein product [Rotaria socialis]